MADAVETVLELPNEVAEDNLSPRAQSHAASVHSTKPSQLPSLDVISERGPNGSESTAGHGAQNDLTLPANASSKSPDTTLLRALHNLPVPSASTSQSAVTGPSTPQVQLQDAPVFKARHDYFANSPPGTLTPTAHPVGPDGATVSGGSTPRRALHSRSQSVSPQGAGRDRPVMDSSRHRQPSLFSRLVALASPTSSHSEIFPTSHPATLVHPVTTPGSEAEELPHTQGDAQADADVDDSDADRTVATRTSPARRRRKFRSRDTADITSPSSNPTTPRHRLPSFLRDHSRGGTPTDGANESRAVQFRRRATTIDETTDAQGADRSNAAGLSEDEGRQRLGRKMKRGLSASAASRREPASAVETRRPAGLRRLTNFAVSDGPISPLRPRFDKVGTTPTQKWRQVKAGLKLLGTRKNERVKIDYQKSAELMAQLLAGSPAAVLFASMYQRDEHGNRKITALLEQLKISIPSSATRDDMSGGRHMTFTINLEYGNGPSRMAWTIHRSIRDFITLHTKYKAHHGAAKFKREDRHRAKLPKFPSKAFPYLRSVRGLGEDGPDPEDVTADASAAEGDQSGTERPAGHKRRQSSFNLTKKPSFVRRKPSSIDGTTPGGDSNNQATSPGKKEQSYQDRQRKMLEVYLQNMSRWLAFRPESTRLCKFLELSAISMRLSAEGGYHGKEALMTIASKRTVETQGLAALRTLPQRLKSSPQRHRPKWFIVKHSYIMAVESPESLEPIEVFLVDSDFAMDKRKRLRDQSAQEIAKTAKASAQAKYHSLKLYNSERKLRIVAKNERQYMQFRDSVEMMLKSTLWSQKQRFDSFAPVRKNCFARWLVDGRDHMWQVSKAIDNARSFVYIHDWWLSPELYLRRPAASSQNWRLDRLLLRKAQQGVKIFVIVYRNIESAIPIDSEHTKVSLLDLHPNICVQRSPNQLRQNQFFWAHHEKLVVVDNAMAFVGGVDLCFGRWDEPSHTLVDDRATGFDPDIKGPRNAANSQIWPGKDYSNPRVLDFYALDKPFEEMYDRQRTPRMPWHDISMLIVGQPARDIARHFVQRWNYILRQRLPSRLTPTLLPPPEFDHEELSKLGVDGSCQIQILRSCCQWSIGTPNKIECSIQNAYCHLIENSEHFIYIENQFFISSCFTEGVTIANRIGDSLVERIIRAHNNDEQWRACIVIPLMPGFQNTVDAQDGTSIRLIMQCQFRSICRGENSIFGRLRAHGIDPKQYIDFYALRQWGRIGHKQGFTTEQLYIHAKCIIVDDRYCIIGSANINERSMLGSRDSEVAAVVADQAMIPSFMGGKPYKVGVFPHTLRMRLMREHLGLDVDGHAHEMFADDDNDGSGPTSLSPEHKAAASDKIDKIDHALPRINTIPPQRETRPEPPHPIETTISPDSVRHRLETSAIGQLFSPNREHTARSAIERQDQDVAGHGFDHMAALAEAGITGVRETVVDETGHEVLTAPDIEGAIRRQSTPCRSPKSPQSPMSSPQPPWEFQRSSTRDLGLTQLSQLPPLPATDDTDIGGPTTTRPVSSSSGNILNSILKTKPVVKYDCMRDPLVDTFSRDIWHRVAENNTKLYRQVFRCMPDSEIVSWKEYRDYTAYSDKFMHAQGLGKAKTRAPKDAPGTSGPPGSVGLTPEVPVDALGVLRIATTGARTSTSMSTRSGKKGGLAARLLRKQGSRLSNSSRSDAVDEKARLEAVSRASDISTPQQNGTEVHDEKAAAKNAAGDNPPTVTLDDGSEQPARTLSSSAVHFDSQAEKESLARTESRPQSNAAAASDLAPTYSGSGPLGTSSSESQQQNSQSQRSVSASKTSSQTQSQAQSQSQQQQQQQRRRRATTRSGRPSVCPEEPMSKEEAEDMLNQIQGHLVLWPYDWLEREEAGGNWLYNIDQIAPLEIYD